jgi:2-polyprenyl-3-methyl-5-hydroxy-6-metoxy-1,4-benzoquinol methylase
MLNSGETADLTTAEEMRRRAGHAAGSPIWKLLGADLHMQTLQPNYAPTGLLEIMTPSPKRVLDVGCFCGGTGRWLKARFSDVHVVGIEVLAAAAAQARGVYDRVIEAPIEAVDFELEGVAAGSLDAIVAADVLEHLVNPWAALQRLRPLLAPGGAIFVSLPNVRNLNVLLRLASGEWRYVGAGILDVSHLRFFTRTQAIEMLNETGWKVEEVRSNPTHKFSQPSPVGVLRRCAQSKRILFL